MRADARAQLQAQEELLRYGFSSFPRFCGLLDIVPKQGGRIKFKLNEIQRQYCAARTARDVVLKPRQIGFTTLEQARDLYHFLTVPGARAVVTCQSMTEHTASRLLYKNYEVMLESLHALGLRLKFKTRGHGGWELADRDATLRIVEAGASQAAAEKKGRAGTITRLHLTETAFYEYADETLNALEECVPGPEHGSEIVSESTPNGAAGVFYDSCQHARDNSSGYRFHFFPWFQATEYRLPLDPGEVIKPETERERLLVTKYGVQPEQLKWYRRKLAEKRSQDLVDQEYPNDPETCFLTSGRLFFELPVLNRLAAAAQAPLKTDERGRLTIFKMPVPGVSYLIGADAAEGVGGDAVAALVYRVDTGEHVATLHGDFAPWDFGVALHKLALLYSRAVICPERNNHGHAVILALTKTLKYDRVYVHSDDRYGWPTDPITRPVMLDKLWDSMSRGVWKTPDLSVVSQMRKFVINKNGKPEAAPGAKDDLVMASAVGWAALTLGRTSTRFIPSTAHA